MKKFTRPPEIKKMTIFFLFLALTIVQGCSSKKKEVKKDDFFTKWKIRAESSRGYSPPNNDFISEESIPLNDFDSKLFKTEAKPSYILGSRDTNALTGLEDLPDRPVTIKMKNTDISVLLRALAKAAGKNVVISSRVSGETNINAEDVPWKEAFASLLRSHGLTYNIIGDTLRIKTLDDMKQDFEIENEFLQQKSKRRMLEQQNILTKVFFLKYAEAKEVAELIKPYVSKTNTLKDAPQKSVAVDARNNAVIIHASEIDINQSRKLIEQIDRPTKQILIEAQIIETTKETARALGMQWGGVGKAYDNNWIKTGTSNSLGTLFDKNGKPLPVNPKADWGSNFPVDVAAKGFSLGYIYEDLGQSLISAQLTALEDDGKLNILSTPSITTMDNRAALIESGRDVPYQTVEDNEVSIEWKKAVLKLEVTPHIIDSRTLRVKIKTNKDELDWTNAALTKGNPTVITKKAETDMILFDGETTVIGGLNKHTENKKEYGVPFLKDIPLLGFLFRGTENRNDKEEILIFITPRILKPYKMKKDGGPVITGNEKS